MFHNENKYDAQNVGAVKTMPKLVSGFTLIELLIVIAIIGILASVVLGSLNTARTKANDAAIKSNLNNLREQASIWYDDNGQVYASANNVYATSTCPIALSSGNIFSNQKVFDATAQAYTKAGGVAKSQCVASATTWAVAVQLATSDGAGNAGADSWCVDSTGSSRSYAYGTSETIANAITTSDACR